MKSHAKACSAFFLLVCSCLTSNDKDHTSAVAFAEFSTPAERPCNKPEKIRGITLGIIEDNRLPVNGYGSSQCLWAIEEIADLGAQWVTITPYITMINCEDTEIIPFFEFPREKMEAMVIKAIGQAKSKGMKVFLVPHLYPWDWCWRGHLRPGGDSAGTTEGWNTWFESYRSYILGLANMASEENVDMLSIGVEFKSASNRFGYRFGSITEEIRSIYPGYVTYCANWDEAEDVTFWDHLDYIGINAFYPMSRSGRDDPEEILQNAYEIAERLGRLSDLHRKPVIFTEIGFKALKGALKEPWIWPEHVENPQVDDHIQQLLYEATFFTLWGKEWFHGLFIWRYMADPSDYSQEPPYGYVPRLKPAEKVIEDWFRCGF